MNTWPDAKRRALTQDQHEEWNTSNYPGTRQLCYECGDETGRCEEDALWREPDYDEPLCESCYQDQQFPPPTTEQEEGE